MSEDGDYYSKQQTQSHPHGLHQLPLLYTQASRNTITFAQAVRHSKHFSKKRNAAPSNSFCGLRAFNNRRDTLTATDTKCCESAFCVTLFHLV